MKTEPNLQKHLVHIIKNWNSLNDEPNIPNPENQNHEGLNKCFQGQACIGWLNFMQGIIHNGWMQIQSNHYLNQRVGVEHSESRWNKRITEALLLHFRTMWNERCRILQAEKAGTFENRQREAAYEFCKSFKFKLNMFHQKHHHLLRKQEFFFRTSTLDTIFMWHQEVYSALQYKVPQQSKKITNFFRPPK